jgi:hypothetical protein
VYVLNNNENLKMSKYIPKVGEAFEWQGVGGSIWFTANKCICETRKAFGYECDNGWIKTVKKLCEFRPIQTKSDVEREQLVNILRKDYLRAERKAEFMQDAGFTIPKKVKRKDIYYIANLNAFDKDGSSAITDAMCELLGDLVEQDKGGAE